MIRDKFDKIIFKITPVLKKWAFSLFVVNATSYIFSAPILLWWGMPLSGLSFLGNVLFSPALAVFIMLCAVLMSASLLGFSCVFLAIPLEKTTEWWFTALKLGSKSFLYGQIAHPLIIVVAAWIVLWTGFSVLYSKTKYSLVKSLLIGSLCTTLLFALPLKTPESILTNRSGNLKITQTKSTSIRIEDTGFFKGLKTPAKGIPFNVKRPIMQAHGTLHVKNLTTTVLSSRTLESIAEMIIAMDIQEIGLPYVKPPQTPSVWRNLARVRRLAKENNIKIMYAKRPFKPQNYA